MRLPFWLVAILSIAGCIAGCSTPAFQSFHEEIESVPSGRIGEWRIGGRDFVVNSRTMLGDSHLPEVGTIAAVRFFESGDLAIASHIEALGFTGQDIHDGPHELWLDDQTVQTLTVDAGHPLQTAGPGTPDTPVPPPSSWPAPSRLLAISDIEGNHDALLHFLQQNGVVDPDGHWSFDDGHLLFNGDIVDRGDQVTEVLWLIRRLQREATADGGAVHFVIGNHESMIMAGDDRYVHPKYHVVCSRLGIDYRTLYGSTSTIGRWLRAQNCMVRIGPLLFVHGGYSPALYAMGLTIDEINAMVRATLGGDKPPRGTALEVNAAWNADGPLWYRGHFGIYGPVPDDADIVAILDRHQVRHIVVGHTVVDDVCYVDEDQRVIGIDVQWSIDGEAEGLLLEDGNLRAINASGARRPLAIRVVETPPV